MNIQDFKKYLQKYESVLILSETGEELFVISRPINISDHNITGSSADNNTNIQTEEDHTPSEDLFNSFLPQTKTQTKVSALTSDYSSVVNNYNSEVWLPNAQNTHTMGDLNDLTIANTTEHTNIDQYYKPQNKTFESLSNIIEQRIQKQSNFFSHNNEKKSTNNWEQSMPNSQEFYENIQTDFDDL